MATHATRAWLLWSDLQLLHQETVVAPSAIKAPLTSSIKCRVGFAMPDSQNSLSSLMQKQKKQRRSVAAMASYEVKLLMPDGQQKAFMAPDDEYILDSAEEQGVVMPASCRSGACSACCAKLLEGEVDQSDGSFLSDEQIKAGFVLTCVAYPLTPIVLQTHTDQQLN